jgi:hypothetical protein
VNHVANDRVGCEARLYFSHLEGKTHGSDTEDGGTRHVLMAVNGDPDLIHSDVDGRGNRIGVGETVVSSQT